MHKPFSLTVLSLSFCLGGATFQLPENLEELEESLGGVGGCVSVGFSAITTEGESL